MDKKSVFKQAVDMVKITVAASVSAAMAPEEHAKIPKWHDKVKSMFANAPATIKYKPGDGINFSDIGKKQKEVRER